ncbi:MAG TPA: hypothetical protein VHJ99_04380 [Candidatus Dormibacteraeota bacterium]|nr:hypothetical protein [Candidatus Dormibacteraeota bacterium]
MNRAEYVTSYVPLCLELNVRPWGDTYEDGDQFFLDSACHVVHSGSQPPKGAVWLPSLFDWLELLEVEDHGGIAIENVGEEGWHVYPIGNSPEAFVRVNWYTGACFRFLGTPIV